MASRDFGTVRIHDVDGVMEVSIPFVDKTTRAALKEFRPEFDKGRRTWKVVLAKTGATSEQVVAAVEDVMMRHAPEEWLKAVAKLAVVSTTTQRYNFVAGLGGVRLRVAPGHKHEYSLRDLKSDGVDREGYGGDWIIPAVFCLDKKILGILKDILTDDRAALASMIDYMEGFTLTGTLGLIDDERREIGVEAGGMVYAVPAFVRKADPTLKKENLIEHPFKVVSVAPAEDGLSVVLAFATGAAAWNGLRLRYGKPAAERSRPLDMRHAVGKWVRRRV
jgi:hypothetical protein